MENSRPHTSKIPLFALSCWVLGACAVMEVLLTGVAVARRFSTHSAPNSQIVVLQHDAPPEPVKAPAPAAPVVVAAPKSEQPEPAKIPEVPPEEIVAPPISNPEVVKLLNDARTAKIADDMGSAISKLEQAKILLPNDPNVLYELGLVHEAMGVYDTASQYYEQVFRLGTAQAGTYYELAARKLREGIQDPTAMRGKLSLGRVRIFRDPKTDQGQRVVLTIPVLNAPGNQVTADDFVVTVRFFDQAKNHEIVPCSDQSETSYQWVTGKLDWVGGQEELRVTYVIPNQSEEQQQLFGARSYYGQIVELSYKNELCDLDAWPRDLAARSVAPQKNSGDVPDFQKDDSLPPDFNPELPLLPGNQPR